MATSTKTRRRARSIYTSATSILKLVNASKKPMNNQDTEDDEDKASTLTRESQSAHLSRHTSLSEASARFSRPAEAIERSWNSPPISSCFPDQEELCAGPSKGHEEWGQGATNSDTPLSLHYHLVSPNPTEHWVSGLRQIHGQADSLTQEVEKVQHVLEGIQQRIRQDISEKASLEKELRDAHEKLQENAVKLELLEKRWRKATSELNEIRSQDSGLHHVTDDDLITSVQQLRYDIQLFSVRYFSGTMRVRPNSSLSGDFSTYLHATTPGADDYMAHLTSGTYGPAVVQSYLWRVFVGEISERFYWAPSLQMAILQLHSAFKPAFRGEEATQLTVKMGEAERKFQMWKATTSTLLLQATKRPETQKAESSVKTSIHNLSERVLDVIRSYARHTDEDIYNDLRNIIESFVALDQKICGQAARIFWELPARKDQHVFNHDCMRVEPGATSPRPGDVVDLVITPGLTKRGKSTGENYGFENQLLKMEVVCISPSPEAGHEWR